MLTILCATSAIPFPFIDRVEKSGEKESWTKNNVIVLVAVFLYFALLTFSWGYILDSMDLTFGLLLFASLLFWSNNPKKFSSFFLIGHFFFFFSFGVLLISGHLYFSYMGPSYYFKIFFLVGCSCVSLGSVFFICALQKQKRAFSLKFFLTFYMLATIIIASWVYVRKIGNYNSASFWRFVW